VNMRVKVERGSRLGAPAPRVAQPESIRVNPTRRQTWQRLFRSAAVMLRAAAWCCAEPTAPGHDGVHGARIFNSNGARQAGSLPAQQLLQNVQIGRAHV
jgi:hypothetical protein